MKLKEKKKIVEEWRANHGAARFDLRNRDVILNDGGLFSIEKTTKKVPRTRMFFSKKPDENGNYPVNFVKVKGSKVVQENYDAYLWFEELEDTIKYLQSMKRMLNQIGYKTSCEFKEEFVKKIKGKKK